MKKNETAEYFRKIRTMPRDFKGIWIPQSLWLDPRLSPNEIILLAEVVSLDDGDGCFASNEYLGNFLGVSSGRAANILSHLRNLKLIKTISFDGRKRKIKADLTKTVKADLTKTVKYSSLPTGDNKERCRVVKKRQRRRSSLLDFSDGKSPKNKNLYHEFARRLYDKCASKRKVMRKPNLFQWANDIRKLRDNKWTIKEIKETLDWYIDHFGEKYVPKAYSGKAFREKFIGIRDQMENLEKDQEKDRLKYLQQCLEEARTNQICVWRENNNVWQMFPDGSYGYEAPDGEFVDMGIFSGA